MIEPWILLFFSPPLFGQKSCIGASKKCNIFLRLKCLANKNSMYRLLPSYSSIDRLGHPTMGGGRGGLGHLTMGGGRGEIQCCK